MLGGRSCRLLRVRRAIGVEERGSVVLPEHGIARRDSGGSGEGVERFCRAAECLEHEREIAPGIGGGRVDRHGMLESRQGELRVSGLVQHQTGIVQGRCVRRRCGKDGVVGLESLPQPTVLMQAKGVAKKVGGRQSGGLWRASGRRSLADR